jgi:hypothetical protein
MEWNSKTQWNHLRYNELLELGIVFPAETHSSQYLDTNLNGLLSNRQRRIRDQYMHRGNKTTTTTTTYTNCYCAWRMASGQEVLQDDRALSTCYVQNTIGIIFVQVVQHGIEGTTYKVGITLFVALGGK